MPAIMKTYYVDDLDGSTNDVELTTFYQPDGTKRSLYLSRANRARLRQVLGGVDRRLARFVEASTIAPKSAKRNSETQVIREWGHKNGYAIGSRGRLPLGLIEAYRASSK